MIHRARLLSILLAAAPACAKRAAPAAEPAPAASTQAWCDGYVRASSAEAMSIECDEGYWVRLVPDSGLAMPWLPDGERVRAEWSVWDGSITVATVITTQAGVAYRPDTPENIQSQQDCFITTAVSLARGLPDDCDELTVLRAYRDRYLAGHPDVATYYRIAPAIVRAVATRPDAATIWRVLYEDYLAPIVAMVRAGRDAEAHAAYRAMVADLELALG
jgi:hypothetical protein